MGVKHFTEFRAWQLANRLRTEIFQLVRLPPAVDDRRFCDDVTAAAASVCSNIAEGFGRYVHGEFARFVTIARGSLSETQDHLIDARARGYLSAEKFDELWSLSIEAMRSVNRLLTHLRTSPTPPGHTSSMDRH